MKEIANQSSGDSNPIGYLRPELILSDEDEILAQRFDVYDELNAHLGTNWRQDFTTLIQTSGVLSYRDATDSTCREANPLQKFGMITLDGDQLIRSFPRLETLYRGLFAQLMSSCIEPGEEPLKLYDDPKLALEVYAQIPPPEISDEQSSVEYRLDAHTDGRYTAILVIDAPPVTDEVGRLVVSNNPFARNVEEINDSSTVIAHRVGTLLCAPRLTVLPHYTETLLPGYTRAIISINYPKQSEEIEDAHRLHKHFKGEL